MRVLVTGSRYWSDCAKLSAALDSLEHVDVLVQGSAPGADSLAVQWANERGIKVESHPADWSTHGRAAGPIRNAAMVKLGADLYLGNGE